MFFEQDDFSPQILTILNLKWGKLRAKSALRPFHALSIRTKGNGKLIVDENNPIELSTGDLVFIPANLVYTLSADEAEEVIVIHFNCDAPLPSEIRKFTPKNPEYFERKFNEIFQVWGKKQVGYQHDCKAIFHRIALEIERQWGQTNLTRKNGKLGEAIEYCHNHFTEKEFTVESLAKHLGMSDTYLRKLFCDNLSTTPRKYINQLRLTLAGELLQSNYYSVEEISEMCGFNNINYFSLFIKKHTGYPPLSYRNFLEKQI